MEKVIEICNLTKNYGKFTALSGVNLDVLPGEIYGFIGPNGAGKTTTIRVLLGAIRASSGSAKIFGLDAWQDAVEIHKRLAFVPGDVSLWANLSGGEVIDLLSRLRRSKGKSRRDELIARFELDPSKKCRTYSKGNRQKVALIAAFSVDADVYILDEPTSGLDPLMEKVFQECIEDAKKCGKAVLLSSHILQEVERLCDKVSIIKDGRIIESGSMRELRHLTRTTISAETEREALGFERISGVHDLEVNGNRVCFSVESEALSGVVQRLAELGLIKLESSPPTLEELFIRHYQSSRG